MDNNNRAESALLRLSKTSVESYGTWLWWTCLSAIAVVNIGIWMWTLAVHSDPQAFPAAQVVLSGCYVLVCAFRSFWPRIDLERYCLFDTPLSSIALGRSLATLAEVCFSIQCALLLHDLGLVLASSLIITVAWLVVPIILLAQVCCWRATLTLDHLWHAAEEALWVVMIALVFVCCVLGFVHFDGIQRGLMAIGIVACVGAAYVMLVVDIPMYLARSRATGRRKNEFLPVGEGFRDTLARRVPTSEWSVWKAEVMWITTYFTVGVWLSIGMVFARF